GCACPGRRAQPQLYACGSRSARQGVGTSQTLTDTAQQAMHQIKDKQYHTDLIKRGVKTVIALGFAFFQKQVAVVHTELTQAPATQP
ncbi:MAG: hypothetical protein AAF320_02565, partial [Myxococcota bacterium]